MVDARTVARVAGAQALMAPAALDRAVADALFAASAGSSLGEAAVRTARRGALARALLETLAEEARGKGPPTDAEVNRASEEG